MTRTSAPAKATAGPAKATAGRARRQAVKKPARPPAKPAQPAPQPAAEAVDEPRTVSGLRVTANDPLPSPLSGVARRRAGDPPVQMFFSGYRVLTLEDGTQVFGCGECPDPADFTGTRGEVRSHRVEAHNMNPGGARKKQPEAVSPRVMGMTLADVFELASTQANWADVVDQLLVAQEEWRGRALDAEKENKQILQRLSRAGITLKVD